MPLKKGTWDHDVKAMLAAAPNGGLYYICNPNNPTGTLTSKADIEWLVANKPAGSVVLVDEAYIHISPSAVRCSDLVAQDKDVLVLRTFSKLYRMAGLRAGAALARPDILEKIRPYSAGAMPITAVVGANASLKVKNLVSERRKIMGDVREDTFSWLNEEKRRVHSVRKQLLHDQHEAFRQGILRRHGFAVKSSSAVFSPVWPEWVRVTIGTKDEMTKFKEAFTKVYNA